MSAYLYIYLANNYIVIAGYVMRARI